MNSIQRHAHLEAKSGPHIFNLPSPAMDHSVKLLEIREADCVQNDVEDDNTEETTAMRCGHSRDNRSTALKMKERINTATAGILLFGHRPPHVTSFSFQVLSNSRTSCSLSSYTLTPLQHPCLLVLLSPFSILRSVKKL